MTPSGLEVCVGAQGSPTWSVTTSCAALARAAGLPMCRHRLRPPRSDPAASGPSSGRTAR